MTRLRFAIGICLCLGREVKQGKLAARPTSVDKRQTRHHCVMKCVMDKSVDFTVAVSRCSKGFVVHFLSGGDRVVVRCVCFFSSARVAMHFDLSLVTPWANTVILKWLRFALGVS